MKILVLCSSVSLSFSNLGVAQVNNFKVYKQCTDEMEWSCDVIREVNAKKEIYFKDIKSPNVERLNADYYHIMASCGNPCQVHAFIGRDKKHDDRTDGFVTVDPKTQCLIESDDKKNRITARRLNSDKKIELVKLNQKLFNEVWIPDYGKYMPFQSQSHFDGHGNLVLIADYIEPIQGKSQFKKTYLNPCKL
ncbi:hypothetical protein B9T28_01235 [Acinetobacter silvestris]|uniref:Uncharacterized protein n=1 Tax=Acinetobacter silvestris TaxID=1977882 RepID=A0A1Y3CMH2_9GAMM|nr:hypothetical protein B9T28_01235 [Acinetobacter silvestris]